MGSTGLISHAGRGDGPPARAVATEIVGMAWAGYLVLTLTALLAGYLFWVRLNSQRLQGRGVGALARLFPPLGEGYGRAAIYCYSANCAPCRQMAPTIERLSRQYPNLFKLDVQEHSGTARQVGIRATPTTLLVENGTIIKVLLGAGALRSLEVFLGSA